MPKFPVDAPKSRVIKENALMERTQVLERGQIVLPEVIRRAHHWNVGQELLIVDSDDGVLLTAKPLFETTALDSVAGCLKYSGKTKTLDEMNAAISEGVKQSYADLR